MAQLFDNIKCIRLMGGEPLLHSRALDFAESARRAFPNAEIALVTNGILLPKQADTFWKKCAEYRIVVDLTRYPLKLDYDFLKATGESFNVEVRLGGPLYEGGAVEQFRKYLNMEGNSNADEAFAYCQARHKCVFLRGGKLYPCRLPAVINIFNKSFGTDVPVEHTDSIDIHADISPSDVIRFLNHPIPFCRWCLIGWPYFRWGLSRKDLAEWIPDERDLVASRLQREVHRASESLQELVHSSQLEEALKVIESVEERFPISSNDAEWNYLAAFCRHNLQIDLPKALNQYTDALDSGYYEFWVRYNRGALRMQLGNLEEAREDLERAKQLEPDHEGVRIVLEQLKLRH